MKWESESGGENMGILHTHAATIFIKSEVEIINASSEGTDTH
jgi:hypothetical protein